MLKWHLCPVLALFLLQWLCSLESIYAALYPAPGSYYSLLLQYNNRVKTRKVARLAPSPDRLFAFFDPPATLGSISHEYAHNALEKEQLERMKARRKLQRLLISRNRPKQHLKERFHKQRQRFPEPIEDMVLPRVQPSKLYRTNQNLSRRRAGQNLFPLSRQPSKNSILDGSDRRNTLSEVAGSCGGAERVSFSSAKGQQAFFKRIQSEGFPYSYPNETECRWTIQLDDDCQMGMIIHRIEEGRLLPSNDCSGDSLSVGFKGHKRKKVCGYMEGNVGTHKWTKASKRILEVTLKSSDLPRERRENEIWGFRMTLTGYCWLYSSSYDLNRSKPPLPKNDSKKQVYQEPKLPKSKPQTGGQSPIRFLLPVPADQIQSKNFEVSIEASPVEVDNPRALTLDDSGRPFIYDVIGASTNNL